MQRCCTLAEINYGAIPEELRIKEVYVTKGVARKKVRFMGRGRTGLGMIRKTHVTLKTEVINFGEMIENARTPTQKSKWQKREALVRLLKENPREPPRTGAKERKRQASQARRDAREGL